MSSKFFVEKDSLHDRVRAREKPDHGVVEKGIGVRRTEEDGVSVNEETQKGASVDEEAEEGNIMVESSWEHEGMDLV